MAMLGMADMLMWPSLMIIKIVKEEIDSFGSWSAQPEESEFATSSVW